MILVRLPAHLRVLVGREEDLRLTVVPPVTLGTVLDALEQEHPVLRGTIRHHTTARRRDFVRFFAAEQDWSHRTPDTPLPHSVAQGQEPLLIVGAIAGG